MKILFFGTPNYVHPILEMLHKTYNTGRERQFFGVVTQPPKAFGREKTLTYTSVDTWAFKRKLEIYRDLEELPSFDLGIVAAYGAIIPDSVISLARYGLLNIHPSLLPEFRGASPIQAALATGKAVTGVSVIQMDSQMDHGPLVSQFKETILSEDTNESLRQRLFERSALFLEELIPHYISGKIKPKAQNHEAATFTKLLKREDGYIPGSILTSVLNGQSTEDIALRFVKDMAVPATASSVVHLHKAFSPWPGLYTKITLDGEQKLLKLKKLHTEGGKLVIDEVQLEGKNPVIWKQFLDGHPEFSFAG